MLFAFELYKFYLGTRLSISFQHVSVDSILFGVVRGCCHRLFVVVTVDGAFIFVGDGHGISQADSSLQCRMRVCARVGDLLFGCWRFICCIRLVQFGSSCSPWL